ncbi:MAG TPA: hypothetical protein G4O10_11120 [Dehalococcoidia bacterium]|nr:hypothetical protein [Dehalococcoidia bacterium]
MFIVLTTTYPPSKSIEMAKTFIKSTETPFTYVRRVHQLITTYQELGIKSLGIFEVDDDKVPDGMKELTKRVAELFYGIEGFKYQIEPMLTAEEAIPLLPL